MNPFNDLKTSNDLGLSTLYDISNGNFSSLKNNIDVLQQYNNSLLSGKTDMLSNNNLPIGSRYFINTNQTCKGQQLYTVIDDMKYMKNNDGSVNNNYGLLYSAYGNLQSIDTNNIIDANIIGNNCVEVTIVIDKNGNTDKKYISMDEYNKLDCSAFPKKCKTYTGKKGCDACKEGFDNIGENHNYDMIHMYIMSACVVGLFILYNIIEKNK